MHSQVSARLEIKVVPGSSRDALAGWMGDVLRVKVMAPPEKGKANKAVVRIIANALDLPDSAVRLISGVQSPRKVVEITSLADVELARRLRIAMSD